jgi:hypothetical protein
MLLIEHKAPHLYREDAYREYCWSVDAYGMWQSASFIYLCFEAFSDICLIYGLRMVYSKQGITYSGKYFPWKCEKDQHTDLKNFCGLILRIEDMESANEIKTALSNGRNVIALLPNEMIGCWYSGDKNRIERAVGAARELKVNNAEEKITSILANGDSVWFEEINTDTKGRLFITRDAFISDGYFMDGYGKSKENLLKIKSLINDFSSFKYPLLRAEIRNIPSIWLTHEPLSLIVDVINHGPAIDYSEISIDFPETFEPVSSIERVMSNLGTLKKISFAFQVIPRADGNYKNYIDMKFKFANGDFIPIYFQPVDIEITPSYGNTLIKQNKHDDPTLSRLLSISKQANLSDEVEILPKLMKVDARACLNKIRTLAEKLCSMLLNKRKVKLLDSKFSSVIQAIQQNKILSSKSVGYLHTIRVIGNLASHPSDEKFSETDVRLVSYAFSCVIEEMLRRKLI